MKVGEQTPGAAEAFVIPVVDEVAGVSERSLFKTLWQTGTVQPEVADEAAAHMPRERVLALSVLNNVLDDIAHEYNGRVWARAEAQDDAIAWCVDSPDEVDFWCNLASVEPWRFLAAVARRMKLASRSDARLDAERERRRKRPKPLPGRFQRHPDDYSCASFRGRVCV
jgi:hypothetical protein